MTRPGTPSFHSSAQLPRELGCVSLLVLFFCFSKKPSLDCMSTGPSGLKELITSFFGLHIVCPSSSDRRPWLAFYAFRLLVDMATITPIFTGRSDLPTREISTPSLLGGKAEMFHIVNCYSVWGSTATERTVSPTLALPATSFPTLVVRDFNIHHPLADLMRRHNSSEL